MIGIRDSNPKQISPTGSSWLGREPEHNNGSTQAVMLQKKQIEENVSEGDFVLAGVERRQRTCTHPTSICFSPSILFLTLLHYSFSKNISLPDTAKQEPHVCRYLASLLKGYSTSILLQLIIHKASFSERVIIVKKRGSTSNPITPVPTVVLGVGSRGRPTGSDSNVWKSSC